MTLRALVPVLWTLTLVSQPAVGGQGYLASFSPSPHRGVERDVAQGPGACGFTPFSSSFPFFSPFSASPSGNLPFFYDLYSFRGEETGKTTVVAAYAVEAGRLRRESDDGCVQYRFVVSLVLADTAVRSVARTDDSVTVRMERSPRSEHLLRTHMEVQAAPSSSTLQRVIISDVTRPGHGQLYNAAFPIPDYSGSHLMLSDIALSETDVEEGWTRGEVKLALLPTGRLPEGSFNLYYEIYNLPAGNSYRTEVTIERLEEDREGALPGRVLDEVRTNFVGESTSGPDATLPELRRLDSRMSKGRYRLTVTIHDEVTGQKAERARLFQIGA